MMKVIFIFSLSISLTFLTYSQQSHKAIFRKATKTSNYDYDKLIDYATENFTDKEEVARFFYYWVSLHIDYDYEMTLREMRYSEAAAASVQVNEVLKTRKTTCIGYNNLYESFLAHFDIEYRHIMGYSKQIIHALQNSPPKVDHAWAAIRFDNTWKLVDVTWASQMIKNTELRDYYFDTDPAQMLMQHLPKDPKWQLSDAPAGLQTFAEAPLISPWYISQSSDIGPWVTVEKNDRNELVISCLKPSGWRLVPKIINRSNQELGTLKYKVSQRGKIVKFVIKNYDGVSILRLDAKSLGKDQASFTAKGLAFLTPENLEAMLQYKGMLVSGGK